MNWTEDWNIEHVAQNFKVLGVIEPEDVVRLIEDAKTLRALEEKIGLRGIYELLEE